jgi:hypothetical protein
LAGISEEEEKGQEVELENNQITSIKKYFNERSPDGSQVS